ncbi:MAG: phosphoglucosamine mutase [Holosporaceae bacterium]|nr:phosphoglucosamine mutase [Holosporaceae bacterium]
MKKKDPSKNTPALYHTRFFGTDGIRGEANRYPMTIDICEALVDALAWKYCRQTTSKPLVLIGKDTRISGDIFEHALIAKFCSLGIDVTFLGVVSTPLLAQWMQKFHAELGIMVSASHNPFSDNGIKIFKNTGLKLTDSEELEIETLMQDKPKCHNSFGKYVGICRQQDPIPLQFYAKILNSLEKHKSTLGKIVIDAANGSLSKTTSEIFQNFNATIINNIPNGININYSCGAAYPSALATAVLQHQADIGIAFDGDGDRLILADNHGNIIDGDHILAILAEAENLRAGIVVSTIMANLALEHYLATRGLQLLRTNVGDKYIAEHVLKSNAKIGGEPSGHIILKDHLPTGDGLFCALKILEYIAKSGRSLAQLRQIFQSYPAISRNIKVKDKSIINNKHIQTTIQNLQQQLATQNARLVVRPSGTESLIRIYAEGKQKQLLQNAVKQLESHLNQEEI